MPRGVQEDPTEFDDAVDRGAIDERSRRVDRANLIVGAPAAQGVEVLEGIAEGEEVAMAVHAGIGGSVRVWGVIGNSGFTGWAPGNPFGGAPQGSAGEATLPVWRAMYRPRRRRAGVST